MKYEDVERLVGTALAINGVTGRRAGESMPRVLGFANSRKRSKAFRDILNMSDMHGMLAGLGHRRPHTVSHIDGNSPMSDRNRDLRELGSADENNPRMIMNVRLFTEGVDVPSLSAAAFLDPARQHGGHRAGRGARDAQGKGKDVRLHHNPGARQGHG